MSTTGFLRRCLQHHLPAALLACAGAALAGPIGLVTGQERGTYIQIGRDLSALAAQPAGLAIDPLVSEGSAANVHRLRREPGVRLALVQSDVYQAFLDEAQAGNADARDLIRPLRVVLPLYNEEVYFVVRADSPLRHVHEIEGKRINIGPVGSGTALTASTLYRQMFGAGLPVAQTSHLRNEDALLKLATGNSIDVAIVVAGQPATLFAEMKPEARRYIKLLRLDPAAPQAAAALKTYQPTTLRAASYPNWLAEDVPSLATRALLVTYNYRSGSEVQRELTQLARSVCTNLDRLRSEGHPKWQEVSLSLPPLGTGWAYYPPTERELVACNAARRLRTAAAGAATTSAAAAPMADNCSAEQRLLALCPRSGATR